VTSEPPRWLDLAGAASYCSMNESAFARRVRAGLLPKPNRAAGEASPRWDRLAIDAKFEGRVQAPDAAAIFAKVVAEIAAKGGLRKRRLNRGRL
jgi:predicted DNA-binding transcriptional regulator AlpA